MFSFQFLDISTNIKDIRYTMITPPLCNKVVIPNVYIYGYVNIIKPIFYLISDILMLKRSVNRYPL